MTMELWKVIAKFIINKFELDNFMYVSNTYLIYSEMVHCMKNSSLVMYKFHPSTLKN